MGYLDLYLIHMPISSKPKPVGSVPFPINVEDLVPMDMEVSLGGLGVVSKAGTGQGHWG